MVGYLLAILSSLFFGIYIIPKKIVKLDTKYYLFYMSFGFVAISLIAYLISLLTGNNNEQLFHPVLILVCLRGISWFVASNLFLISIDKIGMSRSTQYKNLKGPFGVLLTLIFLSEFKVTNVSFVLLAALLTFFSALLFTIKKDDNKKIDKSGIIYACIASLFLSVNALIQKYVTNCGFIYTQQLYQSITIMACSFIYVLIKDHTVKKLQINSFKNKILSILGGILYYFATYFNSIKNWYKRNHNVELKQEWLITTPGIVFALATAVKILTKEDDYVLINNPVYYPFTEVVEDNKRKIVSSDLVLINGHYEINFEDLENKIKQYNVKVYLLCSPHNPVGRVWTSEELNKIIEICKRNNVFIVCDEIHSDFIWKGSHTCILNYIDIEKQVILCTAPTKTFNLAGLQVSNIFIPNKEIREKFQLELWNTGYSLINIMGLVACKSAYEKGQDWLNELKKYLLDNINYVDTFLREKLPKIKLIYPEGTYLLWIDFNELNLSDDKIEELIIKESKLWLDNGKMFGSSGKGFQRINIALPREKLKMSLENLEKTFKKF